MIFGNAKWIWLDNVPTPDEYADFCATFDYNGGEVSLKLCAETDYIVYLNGKLLVHGQFAGYKTEKYYDEEDITSLCKVGENSLLITVRYEGINSACHIEDGAGLIFSVECDGQQICHSHPATLSRPSPLYVPHVRRKITSQLGHTSSMTSGGLSVPFAPSREVSISYNFKKRPVRRIVDLEPIHAVPLDIAGRRIFDLGREDCGYAFLRVKCQSPTAVKLAYGEHLTDGCVRYIIDSRDFSLDFHCAKGENYFTQYFIRIAGRYLEILADDTVEILDIGIIPTIYPLHEKSCNLAGLDREIYDVSVRTLRLCMHTHYEDCPWREQALYVLDSRNQMLCGYYAFEETQFQRENLIFISKGKREDGMLELTYPAVGTPAIPFFSAMYPVAVYEYVEHTGDLSILPKLMPTIFGIMERLHSWADGTGLIQNPPKPYWNFYEWSYGNSGGGGSSDAKTCDLIINCAFVYACEALSKLCRLSGDSLPSYDLNKLKNAIVKTFCNEKNGLFRNASHSEVYTVLGNAFAMLIGLGDKRTLKAVKGNDCGVELVPATLSMLPFVYDVILEHDPDGGKEFVLSDIRKNYSYMLSQGATSFWETIEGGSAFRNAGSLCHGWSAMPVYYLKKLL